MTDIRQEIDQLAALIGGNRGQGRPIEIIQGVVWGLGPGSLIVLLRGQQEMVDAQAFPVGGIRFLTSYSPKIGDTVHILNNNGDYIVLGKVNPAYDPSPEFFYIGVDDAPNFSNGWTNFGGAYAPAHFWLDADGFVHLAGVVSSGTATAVMFTLPSGYRPKATRRFVVSRTDGFGGSGVWGLIINESGQVFLENKTIPTNLNGAISLSGICFMAEDLLEDHARSFEWTPFLYNPSWSWDQSHDAYDFPACWQRWDGLVRLRGHVAGLGNSQMVYVPERAARRRYSALFLTLNDTGSALERKRADFQPFNRCVANITTQGGNDVTLDSMYWWADFPEHLWNVLDLKNNWVSYGDGVSGSWGTPTYYLDGYGMVHIRGLIRSGTIAFNTPVALMPEGFRPPAREVFFGAQGGDGINPGSAKLEVDPNGNIEIYTNDSANNFVSLDHITYRAA